MMKNERQTLTALLSVLPIRSCVATALGLEEVNAGPAGPIVEEIARRRQIRLATALANQAAGILHGMQAMQAAQPYQPTAQQATAARAAGHRDGLLRTSRRPSAADRDRAEAAQNAAKWGFRR